MLVSIEGTGPLFQRVYDGLRAAILRGDLPSGSRLPSTRSLAADLGVSRTTVLGAYEQLLAEGYVAGRVGSGTYVSSELPDQAPAAPRLAGEAATKVVPLRLSAYASRVGALDVDSRPPRGDLLYDFRYGTPAIEDFPHDIWRRLLSRRSRSATLKSFRYGSPEGLAALRRSIADYLTRSRAVRCSADQVVVVNGSQQALDLTARVLLDPGDRVLIEEPHYQGARKVFVAAGAQLVPVAVDSEGLDVACIPEAANGARLAYVTPSHQFPSGGTLSLSRRLKLLAWAEANDAHIIEDDYDSEYRYEGRPVESMQGLDRSGRVIYTGTFSKVLFPSLRIGYLVLPEQLVDPLVSAKWLCDRHTPTLEQETLADFIDEGHFERHLRRSRTRHAARRATLLDALASTFGEGVEVQGENAGIHLVAWLRNTSPDRIENVLASAREARVGVYSVAPYYLTAPQSAGLLLGYAHLSDRDIRTGIRILGDVVTHEPGSGGRPATWLS